MYVKYTSYPDNRRHGFSSQQKHRMTFQEVEELLCWITCIFGPENTSEEMKEGS